MRLIFVDDEPLVLQGLRRSLHGMRAEWSMEFANGGAEALRLMEEEPFDVVVTDMRMPEIDGAQLMQEVKARCPRTIRLVLSGQSSQEALLRSIAPSHQFLSKPCNIDELKERITKAFVLRALLESSNIKAVISGLATIPSLPAIYDQVVKELQARDPSVTKIAAIISRDAGMTAKILQLANSALLGVRRQISNPAQAVSLIGIDMIRALVISVHIFSQFDQQQVQELDIPQLWKHSLATASAARAISELERCTKDMMDVCFTAGLLHDIGKLVLIGNLPEKYKAATARVVRDNVPLLEAERECLECTHAEVGAYLMGIWGLPHAIVEAAAWHHLPSVAPSKHFSPMTAVHVADSFISSGPFFHLSRDHPLDRKHLEEAGVANRESEWRQLCVQTVESLENTEAGQ
jgi:HD-like signal output (HDOD) protein/CheY-like chemotaxis protein